MHRRTAFVSAIVALSLPLAVSSAAIDPAAEADAQRAQKILDTGEAGERELDQAEAAIKASLAKGVNAHALVEASRLAMVRGWEDPESLRFAAQAMRQATALTPAYDRAFIIQAHVAMQMGDMKLAKQALQRADELHSTDPWFKLNYAEYSERTGRFPDALKMREEAAKYATDNPKALHAALGELQEDYARIDDRPAVERTYAKLLANWPNDAYVHGDYGRTVIVYFADFGAGERAARESLEIMNYPYSRQTLSLALYGQWAKAKRDHEDPAIVKSLLDKARAYDPRATMVPTCALRSNELFFVRDALMTLDVHYDPTLHNC